MLAEKSGAWKMMDGSYNRLYIHETKIEHGLLIVKKSCIAGELTISAAASSRINGRKGRKAKKTNQSQLAPPQTAKRSSKHELRNV